MLKKSNKKYHLGLYFREGEPFSIARDGAMGEGQGGLMG